MISAALAAGLALTMTVTAFADEPYTAYNYDYWDDAIPSQSAYRVEKTVTGADMGLDRLSDPSDPLYISDDAPAKLSDAKRPLLRSGQRYFLGVRFRQQQNTPS